MAQVSGGLLHECLPPEILASIKKHSYDSDTDAYYVEMHNGYRFTVTKEFLVDAEVSSFKIMLYYAQLPSKRSVVRLIDLGEGMLIPKGMAEALDIVDQSMFYGVGVAKIILDGKIYPGKIWFGPVADPWYLSDELLEDDAKQHQISFKEWEQKYINKIWLDPSEWKGITSIP